MAKVKDLCKANGLNEAEFSTWLRDSGHKYKTSLSGAYSLDDSVDASAVVAEFVEQKRQRAEQLENEQIAAEQAAQEKQRALASMLITSGFSFDGYTITKYSGYISGDDAVAVARPSQGFWGSVNGHVGADLMAALSIIRRNALAELKESAHALGCNAVVGVDFDYITLDPETATNQGGTLYLPFLFAVTANGNAVVIEKNHS